jgi:hypothetical protein
MADISAVPICGESGGELDTYPYEEFLDSGRNWPSNEKGQVTCRRLLEELKRVRLDLELYKRIIDLAPFTGMGMLAHGIEVRADLRRVLELNPDDPGAARWLKALRT